MAVLRSDSNGEVGPLAAASRQCTAPTLDSGCAAQTTLTSLRRFEKSLYDLIRGLRNHKGNEREYIQNSLKECRAEVRSQDMDLKATALLKLIYLEMVGHDMSWASFHVLEVMSSPKYHQKRVGYLGAVQSFRPDTEVLMLATNLLKKDIAAASTTIISLPIATLPHIITPSLALSVMPDLLPRLSHTHPVIRKKTIVTLYRLALVYPETLRAAWPKIKERLMDNEEDPSVTAAIVNVVCELGSRRPHDFLPLAPRLFELLVDGGNNWMAIKLIKLQFATLTPLEPRLVRKLLPPLTDLIRTTPAMSLLYECINGIIQGGILGSGDDVSGTEEIASLCVSKLRGMVMIDGDPNLKYVALLAFNKIVATHPLLVAEQEDAILECIDSPDITIRIQALDLVQGLVNSDNLVSIVSRLMRQLKLSDTSSEHRVEAQPIEFRAESDDESEARVTPPRGDSDAPPLPLDYKVDVIGRILTMCSQNNYNNLIDFDWYIDVLTQLIRTAPTAPRRDNDLDETRSKATATEISERIGDELRNVAVKVRAVRGATISTAEAILAQFNSESAVNYPATSGALRPIAWILGEYAIQLSYPDDTLSYLLQMVPRTESPQVLAACVQAIIKIFSVVTRDERELWTPERKSRISLLMARIIHVLEPLTLHPNLEVQERAVEFSELLKLTAEAASGQSTSTDEVQQDAPLLLTQAIPTLFSDWELNSVAPGAQRNVPLPEGLDLDAPIHLNLPGLLAEADSLGFLAEDEDEFKIYYHQRQQPTSISSAEPAINRLEDAPTEVGTSYQQAGEESYLDPDILARRKAERRERNRDDPFYIGGEGSSRSGSGLGGRSTPIHNILQRENGPDLDIDSIPIMQLDLNKLSSSLPSSSGAGAAGGSKPKPKAPRQRVIIAADETLAGTGSGANTPARNYESENNSDSFTKSRARRLKQQQGLLQVDSSSLGSLSLEDGGGGGGGPGAATIAPYDYERQQREEAEMAQAMREVERLRLEMQRANERIQVAQGVPAGGTVVKKKKKSSSGAKTKAAEGGGDGTEGAVAVKPKKKKKKAAAAVAGDEEGGGDGAAAVVSPADEEGASSAEVVKPKKKKKKPRAPVDLQEGEGAQAE
ncbi:uncharacterized protein E0L32_009786 [Thyridium curvatum]|uniref:AP-3 complex subunit delta n=1 Tax=Thyridium curvatum TaxID=1093900 RepID=A0A507AQF5_9PEZI|nr:uncharacterized protein E0L32_009786 [Thyridium curvatum]TPX08724.1 hypothetical protein E0L32_009786 [Thyridium curvatum]